MAHRSNRRRQRRRGRFSGLYKLLSAVLILAVLVAGCLVFFRVEDVVVSGNRRYTAEEIEAVTGVRQGDNLFALNKREIAELLRRELPYVEEVSIWRGLPDTLMIEVRECTVEAFIRTEEGIWLMNSGGKLLEQADSADVTEITGVTALQPGAGTQLAVGQELTARVEDLLGLMAAWKEQELLAGTDWIDLSSAGRMELSFEGRLTVYVSYASDYEYDAKALRAAISYLEPGEESVVDLTFDDGPHLYSRQEI